jgi:hypothetical protein
MMNDKSICKSASSGLGITMYHYVPCGYIKTKKQLLSAVIKEVVGSSINILNVGLNAESSLFVSPASFNLVTSSHSITAEAVTVQ